VKKFHLSKKKLWLKTTENLVKIALHGIDFSFETLSVDNIVGAFKVCEVVWVFEGIEVVDVFGVVEGIEGVDVMEVVEVFVDAGHVFSASSILISNCEPLKTENVLWRLNFIKIKRINVN